MRYAIIIMAVLASSAQAVSTIKPPPPWWATVGEWFEQAVKKPAGRT